MLQLQSFTFNPFAENSYIVWDEQSLACAIFDPGCSNYQEEKVLSEFIEEHKLNPILLINTHCHIDHVLGNKFISDTYNLPLHAHSLEKSMIEWAHQASLLYQIPYTPSPEIGVFLDDKQELKIGNQSMTIRFTPGHSPGHLTFVSPEAKWALVGDVIFNRSIGRTDLPQGDFETLSHSIKSQIYTLPDTCILYNGHGDPTDVGSEKLYNPFVRLTT